MDEYLAGVRTQVKQNDLVVQARDHQLVLHPLIVQAPRQLLSRIVVAVIRISIVHGHEHLEVLVKDARCHLYIRKRLRSPLKIIQSPLPKTRLDRGSLQLTHRAATDHRRLRIHRTLRLGPLYGISSHLVTSRILVDLGVELNHLALVVPALVDVEEVRLDGSFLGIANDRDAGQGIVV